ncbi:MAG: hypothetical protein OXI80_22655 [Caldilineaceae bacterium]|nr:hypothetical protein [Caldilineaceae bacterium]MDE0340485.1 hypothetical protein [Caldilineaceae bacterium]
MKRQAYILIAVLLFLGCSGGIPGEEQTPSLTTAGRDSGEGSTSADSGAGSDSTSSSLENATGSGALTGVLLLKTEDGFEPVADVKLAIGETLSDDEGMERVVAYDPATSPVAYTDASGRFVFENLESGRYGLILDIVMSSFLLYQEGTLNAVLFKITDGEMTDLGNLEYSELPLSQ